MVNKTINIYKNINVYSYILIVQKANVEIQDYNTYVKVSPTYKYVKTNDLVLDVNLDMDLIHQVK